jgi:hypothetical protein
MDGHHSRQNVQPFERNIQTKVRSTTDHVHGPAGGSGGARALVASPSSFLNFSIDAPTVHLFKLIDCVLKFQYGANLLAYRSI